MTPIWRSGLPFWPPGLPFGLHFCASRAPFKVCYHVLTELTAAGARFSTSSVSFIWRLFRYLPGPMLDPCLLAVLRQSVSGPHLVSPWASAGAPFASSDVFLYPGGTIAGSRVPFSSSFEAICCSWAPFLASTWHLIGGFRGQFDVHQFFPCTTFKQGTNQLPV